MQAPADNWSVNSSGEEVALGFVRRLMWFVGIWPFQFDDRDLFSRIRFYSVLIGTAVILVIPQFLDIFLNPQNIDTITSTLSTVSVTVTAVMFKLVRLRYKFNVIRLLIERVQTDWYDSRSIDPRGREIMTENARFGSKIVKAFLATSAGAWVIYTIPTFILAYTRFNQTGIRRKYISSYFPFDIQSDWIFWSVTLVQSVVILLNTFCGSAVDGFLIVSILHECGQLSLLRSRIENLVNGEIRGLNSFAEEFRAIVRRHNDLSRIAEIIEKTFNEMLLLQTGSSMIVAVLLFYQVITIVKGVSTLEDVELMTVFTIGYISYEGVTIFMWCYVGDKLEENSLSLGSAAYFSNWQNGLSPKQSACLIIIMARANLPMSITAGRFAPLNLVTFTKICKSSMAYVSMLLAMKDRVIN